MFSWKAMLLHFSQMRGYIAFCTILFFAGMVVGGTNEGIAGFMNSQLEGLGELGKLADESANPELTMFIIIFLNNTIKCILIMYLGVAFGILPILFIVVNGMVIGYLFVMLSQQGENVFALIVKGILPHGIIEIPALIVACAYGLKFGALTLRGLVNWVRRENNGFGRQYESFAVRTVPLMILLVISLLVAAVIESTFTVWLLSL